MTYLNETFFQDRSALYLAPQLLGKVLVRQIGPKIIKAEITEVEAYLAENDLACHAANGKRTARTEIMFRPGGKWYVYLIYGIHELCNITCHQNGKPEAILIRAAEIVEGLEHIHPQSRAKKPVHRLLSGPGLLTKELEINRDFYGKSIFQNELKILVKPVLPPSQIEACPRIGVDYAGADALLPYRFYIRNRLSVSKK
jgi:DNA-3-methyladenine glycosylase